MLRSYENITIDRRRESCLERCMIFHSSRHALPSECSDEIFLEERIGADEVSKSQARISSSWREERSECTYLTDRL